jgi:hypothetical protein
MAATIRATPIVLSRAVSLALEVATVRTIPTARTTTDQNRSANGDTP